MTNLKLEFQIDGKPGSACLPFNGDLEQAVQPIQGDWDDASRHVEIVNARIQNGMDSKEFPVQQVQQFLNRSGGPR